MTRKPADPSKLKPGDGHYMAYVGPPRQYDFMGASQFNLLCTMGLRAHHCLLDFGCGSLRAGRFFISYLNEGCYFGIEPNRWLIDEAIKNEIGNDLVNIKKPRFDDNSDFRTDVFSRQFDFIVAQSIFSHTGKDLVGIALDSFAKSLKRTGLIAATFVESDRDFAASGWAYAGCEDYNFHPSTAKKGPTGYRPETILEFGADAGLHMLRLPWYHPRQTWYLLARKKRRLPTEAMLAHLTGVVLFDREFADGLKRKS